jgi:hypothetical protein
MGGQITEVRGTYVHPKLAFYIAQWVSPEIGLLVSDIVNNNQLAEYQTIIAKNKAKIVEQEKELVTKDNKIDELMKKMD